MIGKDLHKLISMAKSTLKELVLEKKLVTLKKLEKLLR